MPVEYILNLAPELIEEINKSIKKFNNYFNDYSEVHEPSLLLGGSKSKEISYNFIPTDNNKLPEKPKSSDLSLKRTEYTEHSYVFAGKIAELPEVISARELNDIA